MKVTIYMLIERNNPDVFAKINNKTFDTLNPQLFVEQLSKKYYLGNVIYFNSVIELMNARFSGCFSFNNYLIAKTQLNIINTTTIWTVYNTTYTEDEYPKMEILATCSEKSDAMELVERDIKNTKASFIATYGEDNVDMDKFSKNKWRMWAKDECETYEIGIVETTLQ